MRALYKRTKGKAKYIQDDLAINALYGSLDAWIDINREALVWQAKQEKKKSA